MSIDDPKNRRRVSPLAALLVVSCWCSGLVAQQPYIERVEVARVLIDVRVFDQNGRPLRSLDASDFSVRIGGRPVRVESAEWVGGVTVPAAAPSDTQPARPDPSADDSLHSGSRVVVFLVQRSLEPQRILGLMEIAQMVDRLLQPLGPEDRVAVLSFDTRLRFWTDFTGDLTRVRSILTEDVITGRPGPLVASAGTSLMATLTPARAERIYGIEHALRHIADSLEPMPGAKSLVLLGYGFGRFDGRSGQVLLRDGYDEAVAALQRARVTVFTLNVTRADYNSLQLGLQTVAAQTGGTYTSTFHFPALAVEGVARALAGYYVLFVEKPDLRPGVHRMNVRLTKRQGRVLARATYVADAQPALVKRP
jgi:VWFA-related protein